MRPPNNLFGHKNGLHNEGEVATGFQGYEETGIHTDTMTYINQSASDDAVVIKNPIGDKTVVETVVQTVGVLTNARLSPTQDEPIAADGGQGPLPPLHDVVDPDALTRLISESPADADVQISFSYAGCLVTANSDDTVRVIEESRPIE